MLFLYFFLNKDTNPATQINPNKILLLDILYFVSFNDMLVQVVLFFTQLILVVKGIFDGYAFRDQLNQMFCVLVLSPGCQLEFVPTILILDVMPYKPFLNLFSFLTQVIAYFHQLPPWAVIMGLYFTSSGCYLLKEVSIASWKTSMSLSSLCSSECAISTRDGKDRPPLSCLITLSNVTGWKSD